MESWALAKPREGKRQEGRGVGFFDITEEERTWEQGEKENGVFLSSFFSNILVNG